MIKTIATLLIGAATLVGCVAYDPYPPPPQRPHAGYADRDRNGAPNRYDRDRDHDRVPDRYDHAPDDPRYR